MLDERDPQHLDPDESIGEIIGKIVTDGRELAEAGFVSGKAGWKSMSDDEARALHRRLVQRACIFH